MKKVFKSVVALVVTMMMLCTLFVPAMAATATNTILKISQNGATREHPTTLVQSSALASASTTDYTLTVRFKVDNHVAGATADARPIQLFNGTNTITLADGKAYINANLNSYGFTSSLIGDCAHGEWHTLTVRNYMNVHGYFRADVTLDGNTVAGIGNRYFGATSGVSTMQSAGYAASDPVPTVAATAGTAAETPAYFGISSYTGTTTDSANATYRGFDLLLDYVNVETADGTTSLLDDFSAASISNNDVVTAGSDWIVHEDHTVSLETETITVPDPEEPEEPAEPDTVEWADPAESMEVTVGGKAVNVATDGKGFVTAIADGSNLVAMTFPKAGYALAAYNVDGTETPVVANTEKVIIPISAACDVTFKFNAVAAPSTPELVKAANADNVLKVTFDGGSEPVFGLSTSALTADQWIGANGSTTDKFTLKVRFKIANLVEGSVAAGRPITLFTGMTTFRIVNGKIYLCPQTIDYSTERMTELGDFTYDTWHTLEMTARQHYHRNGLTVKLDGVTLGGGELMDAANPSAYYWTYQRAAIPQAPLATITHNGSADSHVSSLAANSNGYFFGVAAWTDAAAGRTDLATYRGFDLYLDSVTLDFDTTLAGVPADIVEDFAGATAGNGAVTMGAGSTVTLATGTAAIGFATEVDEVVTLGKDDNVLHVTPVNNGGTAGSGYMPMTGLTSSALSAEQTVDEFDFEIGFTLDNLLQGDNARQNPIALANGTNALTIRDGYIYLSSKTSQNAIEGRKDVPICAFEEGKRYDIKLHIYKDGEKVLTDATVNGVVYKGLDVTYDGITAPTVQSTKSNNLSNFGMPAGGLYFGVAWYGGRSNKLAEGDAIPTDYNYFDLDIDYVNLNFDGAPADLVNDEFIGVTSAPYNVTWPLSYNLTFPAGSTRSLAYYREAAASIVADGFEGYASGLATYGDNAISVIAKLVPGTVDEFGLILSPTAINGTLTKADLANYYITNDIGNSEIYAFPGAAYGSDGRFGIEVNGGDSNYFTAFGNIYAYVYAINETSDVVAYLPVVFN